MAYSKAKFKSSEDKASSCFRPFWIGKLSSLLCSINVAALPKLLKLLGLGTSYETYLTYFLSKFELAFVSIE
jgi:hypothetical protein